ncbi:MAG: hypothetical protein ACFFBS_05545 [Promethearchaeota archaeon]
MIDHGSETTECDLRVTNLMTDRRPPAKWRVIKDISPNDIRVRVVGRVVDSRPGFVVLDDGSGSIVVKTDRGAEIGNIIRAMGDIHRKEDGSFEIGASIIQNMDDLDLTIYMEVYELRKRFTQNE